MLRVLTRVEEPPLSLFQATAAEAVFGRGFYDEEWDDEDRFRWMGLEGELELGSGPARRYLELWVASQFHDLSQTLTLAPEGGPTLETPLVNGWTRLSLPVPAAGRRLLLRANKLFPPGYYPGDPRRLAVRVRRPLLHEDLERHRAVTAQHENAVRNAAELLAGATRLASTPPHLGIDMYGVCNVKPPCVYCEWDWNKALEGENVEAPFNRATLESWGELFGNSRELVNCSIGEPFMMKNFDELLDVFGGAGKALEMTTNGQILTDRNIDKLLGRDIELYISLDAGCAETYAKLRNDSWDKILRNLRRLIEAKGGPHQLPRVHLVFMPMRVNVDELEAFVRLCAELEVDRMVLRPLNYSQSIELEWDRAGYHFDYQRELLPFDELVRVSGRAAALCARHGVQLSDQMDFGGAMRELFGEQFEAGRRTVVGGQGGGEPAGATATSPAVAASQAEAAARSAVEVPAAPPAVESPAARGTAGEGALEIARAPAERAAEPATSPGEAALPPLGNHGLPACQEPWRSLYILRRGIFPCCYGGSPIARPDDPQAAWNSPLLQEIRSELAAGRFHRYCLDSPACPIVRKTRHAGALPRGQALFLRAREAWHRFDKALGGYPRRLYQRVKLVYRWAAALTRSIPARLAGTHTR